MRKLVVGSVLLAALSAGSAIAADVAIAPQPRVLPQPAGFFSWTGWYVGGFIGGAFGGDATTTEPCIDTSSCYLTVLGGEIVSYSLSGGFIGGVNAGVNYQIPGIGLVFGLETEFSYLKLTGSSSFGGASSFANNVIASATIGNWYNATTLRGGWAVWDRVLVYAKGGFAVGTIESTIVDDRGFLGAGTGKTDVIGWAWGGGVEWSFLPNWSVKAEYLWLGLNDTVETCATATPGGPGAGATFCSLTNVEAVQTAKIGVNYLFDTGPTYYRY